MVSDDDFAPEDLDENLDDEEMDFEEDDFEDEEEEAARGPKTPKARPNVYTALLIVSALFYIIALVATFGELTLYCTELPWQQ
ncbi:MAG: hypothetical protein ACOCX4_01345 [Planctomycetota bacterium]